MTNNSHNHSSADNSVLPIWQQPEVIRWSQIMADSYFQLLGQKLIDASDTPQELSAALFKAPFVLVSHDTQSDPIFNYANQTALQLWSMSWQELTKTSSSKSAEPLNRAERGEMLKQVAQRGYIKNYQGMRISHTGKRFLIKQVTIWNLTDESGHKCGQAATYPSWEWL